MGSIPRKKRPLPARSPVDLRVQAVLAFLLHYLEHDQLFAGDLWHVVEAHWAFLSWLDREQAMDGWASIGWRDLAQRAGEGDERAGAYVHALTGLLERNKLDQIPESAETFHDWCVMSHAIKRPAFGLSVRFTDSQPLPIRDVDVTVHLDDEWIFLRERRSAARKRLLALCAEQIDAELDRIAEAHHDWEWPDTKSQYSEHIAWTYLRFKDKSAQSIADDVGKTRKAVSDATNAMAGRICITLDDRQF